MQASKEDPKGLDAPAAMLEQDERVLMIERRMKERSGQLDLLQNSFGETINLPGAKTPGVFTGTLNDTLKKNLMSSSKVPNKPPL